MCTNNNFNIECTTPLLQRFYKIKEKRKWEVICSFWIKFKRYGHHEYKFFHKIRSDSKLCAPSYNKSKWLSMMCEKRFGNINSLFEKETKLKFRPVNERECNKPGKCGFILKTVSAKDGANMILCTDPSEYSEEIIHYHEEFKAKDMYFFIYPAVNYDAYYFPLSWNGVPVIKSGKVYWGELLAEYTNSNFNWMAQIIVQLRH